MILDQNLMQLLMFDELVITILLFDELVITISAELKSGFQFSHGINTK